MVSGDQVGLEATNPPLIIKPSLTGKFVWLSSRSGVFTPSEPLALDTTYKLTLKPDLRCADGQRSDSSLRWMVKTPPFGVATAWPNQVDTNATSQPEIKLAFNAPVRAADAEKYISFCDLDGHQMMAKVQQGLIENRPFTYEFGGSNPLRTWQESFPGTNQSGAAAIGGIPPESSTNEVPNFLIVTPPQPLPIGHGWKLLVAGGIPAADGLLCSREKTEVPIGDITPFVVQQVTARNYIHSGASIQMLFSKPVPETLTNNFRDWIELTPAPKEVRVRVWGRQLTISGDLKGATGYTLKLKPGFKSTEAFELQSSNIFSLVMPHVLPRLYFSAEASDQLAVGSRSFPLLAVNVSKIRIRAKLMDANAAIHALRGYGSYFALNSWEEPYKSLDYNLLPGSTVFDKVFDLGAEAAESDLANRLNLNWDELLGGRQAGVVFLDARREDSDASGPAPGTQALIQLTDLGMVWKKSPDGIDAFIFSHSSGKPVAGAAVRLYNNENQPLREAVTDTNGLAHLNAGTNADWLAAQQADDLHAVMLDRNRFWRYSISSRFNYGNEQENTNRVMIFSDRDLYRPGESMHLEAIVRSWAGQRLNIPQGATGTLQCLDARGKTFFQTNAAFNALGSWSTLVPLPMSSRGGYLATLHFGSNDYSYPFRVQDFKPSAFEILLPCRPAYSAGNPIQIPLSARYLFGKALARAQVTWSLKANDMGFQPKKYQRFNFQRDGYEWQYRRGQSEIALNGRGNLTGTNNFVIDPGLSANPVAPQARAVSLLAEVTDINQQTISRRAEFVWHSSDFYLGLRQSEMVVKAGTKVSLEAVALRNDGRPWPEKVQAHLTLQRVDWQTVRIQGAGRTTRFHSEAVLTNVLEREITVNPVPAPDASAEEACGDRLEDLPALSAGEYVVEIKAEDASGRPVASSLIISVAAADAVSWNYRNDVELALKSDKKNYAPGDTAEILIESPFSGTAMVTVEREKVLRSFVTHLEGNAPSIRIPIESGDVPNVFVSVTLVRGSEGSSNKIKEPEYRSGCCDLTVTEPQNRLAVEIAQDATSYQPGQPVAVSVQVTDSAGHPASGAEVVLFAVDDGILSLTDFLLPDPYGFFYAARPLCVQSGISLPNLLSEDPDALQFHNKGFLGGGGGRNRMRKDFLACAFWNAGLTTDATGKARARFTAPDSLTRYRLFAVTHTAGSRFGSGQASFNITKPLVVEPALPACANITDHLIARGLVFNQTTNSGEVEVALTLDDKAKSSGSNPALSQRVLIPANGSVPVEFPVEFLAAGETKWVWKARFMDAALGNFIDTVQSRIEVGHIAPELGEVILAHGSGFQSNLLAHANPQLLEGRGEITVTVANSRLNDLGEAASQLLHYPYGCAEQSGSCLLPWILLRDTPGLLTAARLGTKDPAAAIRSGVARLFSMQTQSGGLGYWPRDKEPMLWASAYGGMVLAIAQKHGVTLPGDDFDSLMKYLSEELRAPGNTPANLSDCCLGLYALALAGRAEPGYQEKLYSLRGKLLPEDRALLALAIAENKGPTEMIADLILDNSQAVRSNDERFGCPAREAAIRLLAWIHFKPEDPIVDRLVSDLMRQQKQAHWDTTQGDAWAMLALTEYARRLESKSQPAEVQLSCGGQTVSFRLDEQTNTFTQSFPFTNRSATGLSLLSASTNRLYTAVTIASRQAEVPQPRQDRGFSLQRRYDRLDDDNKPQGADNLHVGDRVLVTLRLIVRTPASYVVIDDALPSFLEAVNPEFRTQAARSAGALEADDSWWLSDFREMRKDRCLSFANEVAPGSYVLRYVARVRAAGSVTAPSAKVAEMYHPERCGLTETQPLVSKGME